MFKNVPGKVIKALAQKNYYTARAYFHRTLRRVDHRYEEPPLLVYQMGKVGSSSVTRTLRMANIGRNIYHIHFLKPELIDEYEKKRRSYLSTKREGDLRHIWQYQHLSKELKRGWNGKRWKIVTLIRDPIARNLSAFFEHVELLPSDSPRQKRLKSIEYEYEVTVTDNNLDELIEIFFKKFPHESPFTYFDREFKGVLGIDLFAGEFPKSKGYKCYREKQFDILLIRLEDLNACWSDAIEEFLGIYNVALVQANISADKEYFDIYRTFKDSIQLPQAYIDKMYSSRFSRHFYTDQELGQFERGWSGSSEVLYQDTK
jgi:hypothetical protein